MNIARDSAARLHPCRSILLAAALMFLLIDHALAQRAIPDDNLAYPVLITLKTANGLTLGNGSGFYLNTDNATYLVTAKHVLAVGLPDPGTHKITVPDLLLELLSYSKDLSSQKRNLFVVNFSTLRESGGVKQHQSQDVVVVKVGTHMRNSDGKGLLSFLPGVTAVALAEDGLLGVSWHAVKIFDQVLVGNNAILYGYPVSLNLPENPQFDPFRPLLRKGLVAGQDLQKHSIIIDGPVYRGNSGGPVFEMDTDGFQTYFYLIGLLTEFIPLAERTPDLQFLLNSGYSVAKPMDFVFELISIAP
jgi:hypothetical protein